MDDYPKTNYLTGLLQKAVYDCQQMSPEQRAKMFAAQKRSFILAEAGFGSDRQEAEYAAAVASNDVETIARLEAEAAERVETARKILDGET